MRHEPLRPALRQCGYCHAWVSKACGEGCQRDPIKDPTEAMLAAPIAAPAGAQFGWLIENGKQAGSGLAYRFMEHGMVGWTEDPNKALAFARRKDAEQFAEEDEDAWRIVEHGWHALSAPPQVPAPLGFDDQPYGIVAIDSFDQITVSWLRRPKHAMRLYASPPPNTPEQPVNWGAQDELDARRFTSR